MHEIYLDANASTPPLSQAKEALVKLVDQIGNPSSPHCLGRRARLVLDEARSHVATALGGNEKEVFFTSGATEGNRWLVDACANFGAEQPLKVVTSQLEHPSVIKPLLAAEHKGLISLSFLPLLAQRISPCEALQNADVLFVTSAHNETGIITDFAPLLSAVPPHCMVLCDATQSIARSNALPQRVDALVISGHKMGAFAGIGAVLLRNNARKLSPPWAGGGQETGLRPGTEALHLIAAFGAAAALIKNTREKYAELAPLRDLLEQKLIGGLPDIQIIGQHLPRLPNTSALTLNNVDADALRILIDAQKVCVGFGSACSALAPEPSPALISLGLTPTQAKATVRLSLYPELSSKDIKDACTRLKTVFNSLYLQNS